MPLADAKKSLKNLASHQTQIAFEGYVMETYYLKLGFDSVIHSIHCWIKKTESTKKCFSKVIKHT
jgi:hypothetical protein